MSIKLEVWGDYALFTRPEMKVERASYDVMTPSAARGLIEAIYWHPGMRWRIDDIHVCAPIRFTNLRRNEVKSTVSARAARREAAYLAVHSVLHLLGYDHMDEGPMKRQRREREEAILEALGIGRE